jgi:UDP-glucose 4-epimerase
MKVLVTGGAGFIGSHVVDALVGAGHEVVVVDNLSTGRRDRVDRRAPLHVVDVRSARLGEVFAGARPAAVVHLAAQTSVPRSVADPAFDASVNIAGGLNLLECCRRFGVRRIIYSSSGGAGYGDTDVIPTPERHPILPLSPYGVTKMTVERYLDAWQQMYGIGSVSLRYANVYGPRQDPHGEAGVVAIFCRRLLAGDPPVINGDGAQTRDYVYVADVAAANVRALERPEVTGAVNIGTGLETSVLELCRALGRAAGVALPPVHRAARLGEQRRSCLDPSLARSALGWAPAVTLEAGLRRTIEHFRRELAEARFQRKESAS